MEEGETPPTTASSHNNGGGGNNCVKRLVGEEGCPYVLFLLFVSVWVMQVCMYCRTSLPMYTDLYSCNL